MLDHLNRTMNDNVSVILNLPRGAQVKGDIISVDEHGVVMRTGNAQTTSVPMSKIVSLVQNSRDAH